MHIRAAAAFVVCLSYCAPVMAQMQIGGGTCSTSSLNGVYSLSLSARDVNSSLTFLKALNGAGTATFDGQSKVTFALTNNTNQSAGTSATWSGTYTLQANCTGTLSLTSGETASFSLESYNSGRSYLITGQDGTYVFTGSGSLLPTAACGASLLNGSYTFNGSGFGLTSGAITAANNVSGLLQFDGKSAVTATWYVATNGASATTSANGTFTVAPSCTATATLSDSSGNTYSLSFVITASTGADFIFEAASPLLMFSGSARAEPSTAPCSAATLTGNYSLVLTGRTISAAGTLTGSFQSTGTANFDGVGKVVLTLTANSSLALGVPETLSGTYTLPSSCLGAVTITTGDAASFTLTAYNTGKNYTITGDDGVYPLTGSGAVQPASCTGAAVSGTYAFSGSGATSVNPSAVSVSGLLTFDGRGDVTGSFSTVTNTASAPDSVSGQYVMSSSCTGTATVTDTTGAGFTLNFTVTSSNNANIAVDFANPATILSTSAHSAFTFPGLSVVSAASGQAGFVPPGSIFALYGAGLTTGTAQAARIPLPDTLLNTSVTVNGESAPLFYVSQTQINAQMPLDVHPGVATVVVTNSAGNTSSNSVAVTVPGTGTPGVFVQAPTSQAVVQNQDLSVNSPAAPAHVGDTVVAYFTGGGPVNASGPLMTGGASPSNGPSPEVETAQVTVGGVQSTSIPYAGLTATLVGVYQVNFVIPQVSPGDHNMVLTIDGASSAATTISISK